MLDSVLQGYNISAQRIDRKESFKVTKQWLCLFAENVKTSTGKWRIGQYHWEAFASGIQPSLSGNKAKSEYHKQRLEEFFLFNEFGRQCFICEADRFPEFLNTGYDIYLLPKSARWTMVFCHDDVTYFAYPQRG